MEGQPKSEEKPNISIYLSKIGDSGTHIILEAKGK